MKDITKYDLTKEEYKKCLKTAEIATFMNARESKNPTSVFVVSQPGAGKTGLRSYVEREYQIKKQEESFIEFDPDQIATYHKYHNEILEEFPNEAYSVLQRFVRPALDTYLRQRAVQLKSNIMQEGTFGSTEGYMKIIEFQKMGGVLEVQNGETTQKIAIEGGYSVDVNILAVHRFESLLSSYEREQYFIEHGLPPRAVTQENHDRAYDNMLETIKIIEGRKLYDSMNVFKRGYLEQKPELIYRSGDGKYSRVIDAILSEREKNKKELLEKPEKYIQRIHNLKERVKQNVNASKIPFIEKIEKLESEFVQELEKEEGR